MFTISSTRRCPPVTSTARQAMLAAIPERNDIEQQINTAKQAQLARGREQIETLSTEASKLWSRPETATYALKSLVLEAQRRDLAQASICDDHHAMIRLRSGWLSLHQQIDAAIKQRVAQASNTDSGNVDFSELLDNVSVLGLHFPDVCSPAYGRRPAAILNLYYRYLEGADIRLDLASFDKLQRAQTGRCDMMRIAQTKSLGAACEANAIAVTVEEAERMFAPSAPIAAPTFEQTPFIAQSRELRQLVTMRRIQQHGSWPLPLSADEQAMLDKVIEQEEVISAKKQQKQQQQNEDVINSKTTQQEEIVEDKNEIDNHDSSPACSSPSSSHHSKNKFRRHGSINSPGSSRRSSPTKRRSSNHHHHHHNNKHAMMLFLLQFRRAQQQHQKKRNYHRTIIDSGNNKKASASSSSSSASSEIAVRASMRAAAGRAVAAVARHYRRHQ